MKLTTKDVITILPFDQAFKKELAVAFESAGADRKFELERSIWKIYDMIFEDYKEKHLEEQLEDSVNGRRELNNNFYKEASELASNNVAATEEEGLKKEELNIMRDKLQAIIQNS